MHPGVDATSLIPPCPSWCELPAGHPYETDGDLFLRRHSIGFGRRQGEPLLEAGGQEVIDTTACTFEYEPPVVFVGAGLPDPLGLDPDLDPETLGKLTRAAEEAAAFLRRLSEHPEPVMVEPTAELIARLRWLTPEPEPSAVRRLILGSASV